MATSADANKTDTKAVKTGKPGKAAPAPKPNVFARFVQYLRDVRSEMRRIVWPNREEVRNMWLVVIVTLIFFSVFTLIVDSAASEVLRLLRQIG
jgi:preprotein translocase subunit SecE